MSHSRKLFLHPDLQSLPNVNLLNEDTGLYSFNVVNVNHVTALDILGELITGGVYHNLNTITPICDAPPADIFVHQYLSLLRNGFILVGEVGDGLYDNYFYKGHLGFKDSDVDFINSIYERSSSTPKLFRNISLLQTFSHLSIFNCPNLERVISRFPDLHFSIKFNDGNYERRFTGINKSRLVFFLPFIANPYNKVLVTETTSNNSYEVALSVEHMILVIKELVMLSEVIHTILPSVINGIKSSFSSLDLNSVKGNLN